MQRLFCLPADAEKRRTKREQKRVKIQAYFLSVRKWACCIIAGLCDNIKYRRENKADKIRIKMVACGLTDRGFTL